MTLLLLSACHSAPVSQPPQDATATAPIDATKSLFPLGNYSQSVDKWMPPRSNVIFPPSNLTILAWGRTMNPPGIRITSLPS